jgi:hypothetical protein
MPETVPCVATPCTTYLGSLIAALDLPVAHIPGRVDGIKAGTSILQAALQPAAAHIAALVVVAFGSQPK